MAAEGAAAPETALYREFCCSQSSHPDVDAFQRFACKERGGGGGEAGGIRAL